MKKHLLAIGLLLGLANSALALDVGDISSFMNSGSSTLSKEIKNTTDSGRLINIHLERLSSPLDGGKVIPMDKQDEVLLTPASLLLPAKASEVVRFFYKGPADDKERYYRIVWFDQALSDAQRNGSQRSAVATASARIGTILVVAPRQANFRYQFAGDTLTMADIQMSFPLFALLARGGIDNLDHIAAWKQRVEARPGWQTTLAKGGPLTIPGEG